MPKGQNVEERIVEMRIDNQKFESGAKQTISTLEKLEKAMHLKGDTSSLNELSREVSKFDASPMANGIEKVQASFSALEVAGMRVISNLTDSVYNFVAKTVKGLTVDQVTAGWNKYEEKTASVQTIMNATGASIDQVNEYLEKLMWFSDETSFGFTDMTSALGQMASAGGEVDKLIPLIMGIGNAVAFAGKGASEFSRTIYNLNQSYSGGFLNYQDWKSLQLAGVASEQLTQTLIDAGVALGTIEEGEVTVANFASTLKDKWATSAVMEKAFGYFADISTEAKKLIDAGEFDNATEAYQYLAEQYDEVQSKAALAAQQAKSFAEVIDATKDAVSTGWLTTFEHLFGNYEVATEFWTDVVDRFWDLFASGGGTRNSILEIAFGSSKTRKETAENLEKTLSGWDKFQNKITASGHSMEQFEEAFKKVTSASDNANINTLIDRYGSIENAFKQGAVSADLFTKALQELGLMAKETGEDTEQSAEMAAQSLEDMRKVALEVIRGDHGDGQERIDWLTENGYDPEVIQAMAGNLESFHRQFSSYEMSDEALLEAMEMYYQAQGLSERLGKDSFADYIAGGGTKKELASTEELLEDIDGTLESIQHDAGEVFDIEDEVDQLKEGGDAFRDALLNILDSFVAIKQIFTGDGEDRKGAIENVFGSIEERGLRLKKLLNIFDRFTLHMQFSEDALRGIQKIAETVLRVFKIFGTIGGGVFKGLGVTILTVKDILDDVLSMIGRGEFSIGEALDAVNERIRGLIPTTEDLQNAFNNVANKVKSFIPTEKQLLKAFSDIKTTAKSGYTAVKNWVQALTFDDVKAYLPSMEKLEGIYHRITGYIWKNYPTIAQWLHDLKETSVLGAAFEGMTNFFQGAQEWFGNLDIDTTKLNETFGQLGEIVSQIFGTVFGDPEELKQKVTNFFVVVWDGLKESLKKITFSDVFKAFRMAGLTVFLAEVAGIMQSFRKIENEIQGVPQAISKMFGSLEKAFDNLGAMFKANVYLQIAVAIGVLAGSMWLLSKIPEDKLTHVAVVLGLLALAVHKLMDGFSGAQNTIGSNNKIIQVIPKFAATLIGFALVIGSVAALLLTVKKMDPTVLATALLGIVVLIGTLAIVAREMSKLDSFDAKGIALTFVAIGFTLQMLVIPLVALALMPFGKYLQAVLGVIGLMAALGTLVVVMSKLEQWGGKTDNMLKVAGSMALIALAINMLLIPLAVLAAMPAKAFGKGFAALLGLIVLLGAVVTAMALLDAKIKSENILKWAAALAIVALAIDLMIPAIVVFTTVFTGLIALVGKIENFWSVLGKAAALTGILVLFGAAVVAIGIGVGILGVGMLAAGAGVLLFALALGVMAWSLGKVGEALPAFVQGLADVGEIIRNNALNFAIGAVAFIALAFAIAKVVGALAELFSEDDDIGSKIADLGKSILTGLGGLVSGIGSKLVDALPALLQILGYIAVIVGLYVLDLIPTLTNLIVNAVITLIQSIADSLRNNKDQLLHSVFSIIETVLEVALQGIMWAGNAIVRMIGDLLFEPIFQKIKSVMGNVPEWAKPGWLKDMMEYDSFSDYMLADYEVSSDKLSSKLQEYLIPPVEEVEASGKEVTDSLATGISNGLPTVEEELGKIKTSVSDLGTMFAEDGENPGTSIGEALSTGFDDATNGEGGIHEGIDSLKTFVTGSFDGLSSDSYVSGENVAIGLNNGFTDWFNNGTIQTNVTNAGQSMMNWLNASMGVASPSKYTRETGQYLVQGLSLGINDESSSAVNAATGFGDELIQAITKSMAQVAYVASDDFTISPQITPVVDLSNVNAAAGSMGSLFGGSYKSYVDSVNSRAANISSVTEAAAVEVRANNEAAVSEMRAMGDRLDALGERITNMQIVLDTGVMVGSMSNRMDSKLGQISARRNRAN